MDDARIWSSIPAMVRDGASRQPTADAVVTGTERRTRAELSAAVTAAARALVALGVEPRLRTGRHDHPPSRVEEPADDAFADGSGWRGVHDRLTERGYRVSVVQNPLTSLEDDVAATRRVLDLQDGPTILVGHSWGGTVITEAGVHDKVAGLVYVAAIVPDEGQKAPVSHLHGSYPRSERIRISAATTRPIRRR